METGTVTFQLPVRLYADLQFLAADEQTDPAEVMARQRRAWLVDLTALRGQIGQEGGLPVGVTKDHDLTQIPCFAPLVQS